MIANFVVKIPQTFILRLYKYYSYCFKASKINLETYNILHQSFAEKVFVGVCWMTCQKEFFLKNTLYFCLLLSNKIGLLKGVYQIAHDET